MRRSKRKAATITMQPERRRSQRHAAAQLDEQKIFGKDYGILPSD